jgi:hypothetical protein
MSESDDGDGQLPVGYERKEENAKKYILTPKLDGKGSEVERLKVDSVTRLTILQNKKTAKFPNGRFHDLQPGQITAWCSNKKEKAKNKVADSSTEVDDIKVFFYNNYLNVN